LPEERETETAASRFVSGSGYSKTGSYV
jgi:hypothetical protein